MELCSLSCPNCWCWSHSHCLFIRLFHILQVYEFLIISSPDVCLRSLAISNVLKTQIRLFKRYPLSPECRKGSFRTDTFCSLSKKHTTCVSMAFFQFPCCLLSTNYHRNCPLTALEFTNTCHQTTDRRSHFLARVKLSRTFWLFRDIWLVLIEDAFLKR